MRASSSSSGSIETLVARLGRRVAGGWWAAVFRDGAKAFARRFNVAIWIVAHPTKPQKGTNAMPSLYDVSDSAHWANKADYGLVYHRKDKTLNEAQLAVVKVRMGLPGQCGVETVKFDHRVSRIREIAA